MYAVCVKFEVKTGQMDAFLPLVVGQARNSLEREPGCSVFDVWTGEARPNEVFLYEIYDDRAAFDQHLQSAHFQAFDAATASLIAAKRVTTWEGQK